MEMSPGTVVENRYQVLELVKSGGMGAVYKAQDLRLACTLCALKQMHPGDSSSDIEHYMRRFSDEMRVLTTLRHSGIPRVSDFFRAQASYCMIMDYVEGENLEQLIDDHAVTPEFVLDVAEQVLDILVYLHGHVPPVLHRDIKPANLILQAGSSRIMLVDFGLARALEAGSTSTQTVAGTPGYVPIEQLQGHSDARSDIYSLGATMHHLLAGTVPRALYPEKLRAVDPSIAEPLAQLVDQAMHPNPDERFPDAETMRDAVRRLRRPAAQPPPSAPAPVDPPLQSDHILVVDDDPMVRDVVRRMLEKEHYRVTMAESGEMALEMALRIQPDMIISDLEMPGVDGLALCHKLRSHRQTRDTPVLLLTGRDSVDDEARGLQSAEDYITKPIVAARLIARVQAILRRRLTRPRP